MSGHTPGPWTAGLHEDPQWKVCGPRGPFHIVCLTSQGNDAANARLIALAPEMADFIRWYAEEWKNHTEGRYVGPLATARALLARLAP